METLTNIAELLLDTVKSISDFGVQVVESVPLIVDSVDWIPMSVVGVFGGLVSVMVVLRIVGRD